MHYFTLCVRARGSQKNKKFQAVTRLAYYQGSLWKFKGL